MRIEPVTLDEVRHISQMAAKEILPFRESYAIYALKRDGEILGVASLFWPSKRTVRFAGGFVLPKYRGQGYGLTLNEFRWNLVMSDPQYQNARYIDGYSKRPKWYLNKGFVAVRQFRETTHVRYTVAVPGTL